MNDVVASMDHWSDLCFKRRDMGRRIGCASLLKPSEMMCLCRFLDDNLEDLTRLLLKAPLDGKYQVYAWLI